MNADFLIGLANGFLAQQKLVNQEFDNRAEAAKQAYWDACKLPRKQKKKARKEAIFNYNFYKAIQQW